MKFSLFVHYMAQIKSLSRATYNQGGRGVSPLDGAQIAQELNVTG